MSSHLHVDIKIALDDDEQGLRETQTYPMTRHASSEGNWSPASAATASAMSEPTYSSQGWATSPMSAYSPYPTDAYTFDYLSPFGTSPVSPRPRASSAGDYVEETNRVSERDYCCLYPQCSSKPFARNADLDRHYKQKHTDSSKKASWFCDYKKCNRRREPFHRLDHFRDHLRQYHKEGIEKRGVFGTGPSDGGESSRKDGSRNSTSGQDWWRCPRCLKRNEEGQDECDGCKQDGQARRR
ncbi:hypothetical protein LIA77_08219 [Sarocladium implicatum]|nr:hypothetical protein LIA77_08219 [Sarocladium implicatum]